MIDAHRFEIKRDIADVACVERYQGPPRYFVDSEELGEQEYIAIARRVGMPYEHPAIPKTAEPPIGEWEWPWDEPFSGEAHALELIRKIVDNGEWSPDGIDLSNRDDGPDYLDGERLLAEAKAILEEARACGNFKP